MCRKAKQPTATEKATPIDISVIQHHHLLFIY